RLAPLQLLRGQLDAVGALLALEGELLGADELLAVDAAGGDGDGRRLGQREAQRRGLLALDLRRRELDLGQLRSGLVLRAASRRCGDGEVLGRRVLAVVDAVRDGQRDLRAARSERMPGRCAGTA